VRVGAQNVINDRTFEEHLVKIRQCFSLIRKESGATMPVNFQFSLGGTVSLSVKRVEADVCSGVV
jgi:hypothetical protein